MTEFGSAEGEWTVRLVRDDFDTVELNSTQLIPRAVATLFNVSLDTVDLLLIS